MRQLLATVFLLAAAATQAANSLTLPASTGPFATVMLHNDSGSIPLNIPPDYPLDWGPNFGVSGDVDDNVALIGASEAFADGVAFTYSATTGEHLLTLKAGERLGGGPSRPRFGHDVLLWQGLAIVSAPNAGGDGFQNRGAVFVFNATTGAKRESIYTPRGVYWGLGSDLLIRDGMVHATAFRISDGATVTLPLGIVPEPGTLALASLGVAAGCFRRRC